MKETRNKKDSSFSNSIGKRIFLARSAKGYTQEQLGNLVHLSKSAIGNMEKGRRGVTLQNAIALSDALDCSFDYLLLGKKTIRDYTIPLDDENWSVIETAGGKNLVDRIHKLSNEELKNLGNDLLSEYVKNCPDDMKLEVLKLMFSYFDVQLRANDPKNDNFEGLRHLLYSQHIL